MRKSLGVICGFLFFCLLRPCVAGAIEYQPLWQLDGRGGFSAPNVLQDSAGTTLGFVLCESGVGVVCIGLDGTRLWEHPMAPPVRAAVAVGDVDGDGREDVVAADSQGVVTALDAKGAVLWTRAGVAGRVEADSCPAIADLDGDGKPEILVGDTGGVLSCLDSAGAPQWQFAGDGSQMGPVLVADLYDLPGREIVVTSHDGHIYALSSDGTWLWDVFRENDLFPNSTPVLADVDGDKTPEIYVGGGLHHFYRIDPRTGSVTFEQNVYTHVNAAIAAADLDGDGRDEVLFGNKAGETWCYGADGFRWRCELRKSSLYAAPLLLDIDGDAKLEALFHSSASDLQVFDANGTVVASLNTPVGPDITPLAGDFDGDGKVELLAGAPGGLGANSNLVYARLNVPWIPDARNQTVFAGNRARSGQSAGGRTYAPLAAPPTRETRGEAAVTALAKERLFSGNNVWRYEVNNPGAQRLVLLTQLTYPGGASKCFARHVRAPKECVALSFDVDAPGDYALSQKLILADTREIVVARKEALRFRGMEDDLAYLTETVLKETQETLAAWRATNARAAAGFARQLDVLRAELEALNAAAPDDRAARLSQTRAEAERLRSLAIAGASLAREGSFIAWPYCPWSYFDPRDTIPPADAVYTATRAAALRGEYASVAINVTNVLTEPLDVRVTCGELSGPVKAGAAEHVTLRHAVVVPTTRRELVADALPELDEAGMLRIAPLETQQLWLTLSAGDLPPGDYAFDVTLLSLERDATERALPIAFTVHDLAPLKPSPLRFCVWSSEGGTCGTDTDAALDDLVAHGVNVFFGKSPTATCDAEGNLTSPPNFELHDASVARYHPHGLIMFIGAQGSLSGQAFLSPAWRKAYVAYVRAWAGHMKALGLTNEDWALYPYDEPSSPFTETTLNLVEVAKLTREADPNVQIYADPTSGTTMTSIKMLEGLIDIWCPSSELLERLADEMLPVIREKGKAVWFYDAAGHAKTLSTLGIYRWRFWHAWNMGFTGAGWWVYAYRTDQWKGWNELADFYCTVYPGRNAIVPSKRWEAAREGVQDYGLLALLQTRIHDAETRGVSGPALDDARKLLDEVPRIIEQALHGAGRRLPLTPDGVPLYEDASQSADEARERIIAACIALEKPNGRSAMSETYETQAKGLRILPGQWRPHYPFEQIAWISPPWPSQDYLWLDFPEAIFTSQGLVFLSHINPRVPSLYTDLPAVPWRTEADGIAFDRVLPNGVRFGGSIRKDGETSAALSLYIENGTPEPLNSIKLQTCLFMRACREFADYTQDNKLVYVPDKGWLPFTQACAETDARGEYMLGWRSGPAAAGLPVMLTVSNRAERLAAMTWHDHTLSLVGNPNHPCMHADPHFPDLEPGQRAVIEGHVYFFEGTPEAFGEAYRDAKLRHP